MSKGFQTIIYPVKDIGAFVGLIQEP